jgi:hypothetical protein
MVEQRRPTPDYRHYLKLALRDIEKRNLPLQSEGTYKTTTTSGFPVRVETFLQQDGDDKFLYFFCFDDVNKLAGHRWTTLIDKRISYQGFGMIVTGFRGQGFAPVIEKAHFSWLQQLANQESVPVVYSIMDMNVITAPLLGDGKNERDRWSNLYLANGRLGFAQGQFGLEKKFDPNNQPELAMEPSEYTPEQIIAAMTI